MSAPGAGAGNARPSFKNIEKKQIELNEKQRLLTSFLRDTLHKLGVYPPLGSRLKDMGDFNFELYIRDALLQQDKHNAFADSLGMPRSSTPADLLKEYGRRVEKKVKAIEAKALVNNPALSAKGMEAFNKKIRAEIEQAKQNAARAQIEDIEAYLKEPNISSEEKELQEEFARIEAEEKEKEQIKDLALKNKRRALAKKLRMRENSTHKNLMKTIAKTLKMNERSSEKNLLQALRASRGVPKGMTLKQFVGKSRGGNRKTRRRRV